jgi:type I restriction enzyme, S subunit
MGCEWPEARLGELCSPGTGSIAIGPFGSRMKADTYVEKGVPVIRGTNISETRAWKGDWVYISEETADSMPNCNVRSGDLVFPHRGSIGEVAIIPADVPRYMLSTSLMKFTADPKKVDAMFLFYYFRSPEGRHEILSHSSQVGTPGIGQPLTSLKQFRVPLPPINLQKTIAGVLRSLDDKIELNRRMNETLEAMARAIFKSWFVDFDPVRAKAEGRQPFGMDAATAALFPDSFQDSPLGKIPKGWKVGTLGEIAENPRRGIKPSEVSAGTPYIGLEHMPKRSIALSDWGHADQVASNKFAFKQREILFGKLRPYFHKVGVAVEDGVCSTDILVIRPRSEEWYGLVVSHVSGEDFISYADAVSTGTKMPRTNWLDMARYELLIPDPRAANVYSQFTFKVTGMIRQNIMQSQTLVAIRDALLPKLISGEIRVKNAETLVEKNI